MAMKTVTSTVAFQDPQGNVLANGLLTLDLSAPAELASGGGQVVPSRVTITLTSAGLVPGNTTMWANDQLNPNGTVYVVNIFNSNGLLVSGPLLWSITGSSPIDLSQEVPVSVATLSFTLPGLNSQIFTSSGTFTIPTAITKIKATVVGGGGAGGGSDGTHTGTGGGSGGCGIKWFTGLTPGNTLTVTVGGGGTGVSAGAGGNGVASSVSSGTQSITTITANGGTGGIANTSSITNGGFGGAVGSGGDLNFLGNSGDTFWALSVSSGGAASIFGGHTTGQVSGAGTTASVNGSGGGGAQGTGPFAGGNGAAGIVIFEWIA